MILQNIFATFVEKLTIMANHKLTETQITALEKLGENPTEYYQKHIPVTFGNIHAASTPKSLKQLSVAIAVDVYTSGTGRARLRSCYDCIRQMNIREKYRQGNLESYIRQLDEIVKHYLAILCNP